MGIIQSNTNTGSSTVINIYNNPPPKQLSMFAALPMPMHREVISPSVCLSTEDMDALPAFNHYAAEVTLLIPNSRLKSLASDPSAAPAWVRHHMHGNSTVTFTHVCVGAMCEMAGDEAADVRAYLLPAMNCVRHSIMDITGREDVKVCTMVDNSTFSSTYTLQTRPSECRFNWPALFKDVLLFLKEQDAPLVAKIMPNSEMRRDPKQLPLANYLFDHEKSSSFLTDVDGTQYKFVFDAMVDSFYGAMAALGFGDVKLVAVSGWPEMEETKEAVENAHTYNQKLLEHVQNGTPKRPEFLDTFILRPFHEKKEVKHVGTFAARRGAVIGA